MIRKDMRFDTRSLKHRLRRKEISPEEYEAHLAALPDDSEELEETVVQFTSPYEDRHYTQKED